MFFQNIYDKTLAQASYLIGCQVTKEAIVIDAQRDIDVYLKVAGQNNLTITHITETHIHADFLCGSRELAAVTGAKMYLSDEGGPDWQYEFPHVGVKHGDKIKVGNLSLEVLHTPGHTPESISFLLTDHPASDEPVMIFTGDFVFVGDIGRPDLLEKAAGIKGTMDAGAEQMYDSIQRFAKLPDYVQVWPAHGAGSACGKALGAVPSSTVGYEKIRNWALQYEDDKTGFIEYLLTGQPEPPKYFAMMKKLNKVDRHLLTSVPKHTHLNKDEFTKAYKDGVKVIDTRNKEAYSKEFLPNTINIQNVNSFSTWMGWFMNYEESFILLAEESEMEDLTRKLMRIGLDNIMGFVTFNDLKSFGLEMDSTEVISIDKVKNLIETNNIQILDVRNYGEYEAGHITGAENLFVGTITDNLDKIDKTKQLLIHCQSGVRASIANSLLYRNGIKNIKTYFGGYEEWIGKGNPVVSN